MLCTGKLYISITLSIYIVHVLTLCFNRFIIVEIGYAGRQSDAGVLSNSEFGQALENGTLTIPNPTPLAYLNQITPCDCG